MAHRLLPFMLPVTLVATLAAVSACGGGGEERAQPVRAGKAVLTGGYTAAQLEQALLVETPGYRRNGEPDSGEYGTIKAFQDLEQLRKQLTVDKPRCQNGGTGAVGGPVGNVEADTPAALAAFTAPNGQLVTETLMGVPDADAEKQVNARVPPGCLTFHTRMGRQWSEHRVTETVRGDIGGGSRAVGVTTVTGRDRAYTWYVVFKDQRYLGTVSVFGPRATRQEAERLARESLTQARRILG
ncbi:MULTISPECIES: hypothetical protein [Actinomadura]|uniref:Uncharacterized protein n=1 Tax=Actinomadura litoris TaxID=2678616 RepID=A0A7K1L9B5_9ACTN|nr:MULTISPECIES: hypothetical protein [Actinomadura]MBT2207314.1 hypothetical protein [Actinomadura sp. NEAU-AAG7]MUN41012.1 hypothetical protein [Actinomadura litoris]